MPNDKIAAIGHKPARPDGDIGSFGQTPSLQPRTEISFINALKKDPRTNPPGYNAVSIHTQTAYRS